MTTTDRKPDDQVESLRVFVARTGFVVILVLLVSGVLASRLAAGFERTLLSAAIALLTVMPVTSVLALFVEEMRRRDWPLAAAALVVLVLLGVSLLAVPSASA